MSLVSVLPFGDTLTYWWGALEGEPRRLGFMLRKLVEISAYLDNYFLRRSLDAGSDAPKFVPARPTSTVPARPTVVVVVPALCRGPSESYRLRALLSALGSQSMDCHVIVVDDGSPTPVSAPSAEVLRLARNRGPAAARNRGIARALDLGGDIIALTDADCIPAADWVESMVEGFSQVRTAHAISGATWARDRSSLGRYHERNGTLNGRRLGCTEHLLYGPTCNLALSAALARSVVFDESFTTAAAEDIDFCYRANKAGWRICHWPAAVVHHDFGYDQLGPARRIRRFWRQFRRYSQGERLLLKKHVEYHHAFADTVEIPILSCWAESEDPPAARALATR